MDTGNRHPESYRGEEAATTVAPYPRAEQQTSKLAKKRINLPQSLSLIKTKANTSLYDFNGCSSAEGRWMGVFYQVCREASPVKMFPEIKYLIHYLILLML